VSLCTSLSTATHCNTLQHTATHCSTPQHTAAYCNTSKVSLCAFLSTANTTTHYNPLQPTACGYGRAGMMQSLCDLLRLYTLYMCPPLHRTKGDTILYLSKVYMIYFDSISTAKGDTILSASCKGGHMTFDDIVKIDSIYAMA